MSSRIVFYLAFLLIPEISRSEEIKYSVAQIPKNLMSDAKAVIRNYENVFEIANEGEAVEKVTYAVTILNKNGLDQSLFQEAYDKFTSIRKIKAAIYDKNGEKVRAGLNGDVMDIAAISGYSLYNDYRLKYLDPKYSNFPFTVEYSYEICYNGILNYPDWLLYKDYNISLENGSLTVIAPKGFKIRYLERNFSQTCTSKNYDNKTSYQWTASNIPALRRELFSPPLQDISPEVFLAPDEFKIGGYAGHCDSWTNYGNWITQLNNNRDTLNPKSCEKIKSLVSGAGNDIDKVRLIYEFMQNKVRYVSIKEGMGGWQPFEAETVDRLSYGDCKALANYMKTLLDIAGVKSYYTLVRAGADVPSMREDFPANQFNHTIVCVPVQNDTIWLECTDQRIPFGFLGTFTDDRKALLITEDGGKVVRTKVYTGNDNLQIRKIYVDLDDNGRAVSTINTNYSGLKYDEVSIIERMDDEDKKRFIHSRINLAGYNLSGFSYSQSRTIIPSMTEELKITVDGYADRNGTKLIFTPNLITRIKDIPVHSNKRGSPVLIRRSYCENDTVTYNLHRLYKLESTVDKINFVSKFGEYSAEIYLNNDKLTYIRSLRVNKGLYQVEEYDSFVTFCEQILTEDKRQIILINR